MPTAYAVIVDDEHLTQTEAIAEQAEHLGFQVQQIIPEAGAIYGSAPSSSSSIPDSIARMPGVLEVRPEMSVRLPPADSEAPQ